MTPNKTQLAETAKRAEFSKATEAVSALGAFPSLCNEEALFEIRTNGDWFYRDSPLPVKFCKLFSSILNRIDNQYFLITPVEKLRVAVVQQALVIVDYTCHPDGPFALKSSIDTEHLIANFEQFIIGEESVTLTLDRGIMAKLNRACFYRFINEFVV
ncbi:DUF1285 domain-containing protein [Shewanella schlegeliana]|uniref:DUF1285 domain-containing protein n=1 Tax=Shewanella schlegeliana TaxID=190308 RepID=A0ABS1SVA5_9GAMM|nr:DUF1285 domain-containing protein [Shewanella schlegeliana]MBL4911839.1 DUF1285 domain-containing protein [Shewanella schlegeliana]MCL1110208.1 DUF1285 domain-containing protein [Shewanella schlegeliana]GIU27221.1 DUF1285 domain-containing protein [Shewanella schlegeliana]